MNESPAPLPALEHDAHKGSVGRVLCFAGSRPMPGAAILVVRAAQRAGAGLVTLAVFDLDLTSIVAVASPETIYLDLTQQRDIVAGRLPRVVENHPHDARVAGPGMGSSGHARQLVLRLLDAPYSGPLVLDADALNLIAPELGLIAACPAPVVLTPHPGEAARLLGRPVGADQDDRRDCARSIARGADAICVLKGAGTVVSDGERDWVCTIGNPGMATAGSGDVLTGIIGAFLAASSQRDSDGTRASSDTFDLVTRAVYDHARAGDLAAEARGQRALIASDLIDHLGAAMGCPG